MVTFIKEMNLEKRLQCEKPTKNQNVQFAPKLNIVSNRCVNMMRRCCCLRFEDKIEAAGNRTEVLCLGSWDRGAAAVLKWKC